MKTKQVKEESDRSIDDELTPELNTKTRAQKKAADEELKANQDEPKTSKDTTTKKNVVNKHAKRVAKKPLGIRKTLRNKKAIVNKNKLKNAVKQSRKRGRKPIIKVEPQQPEASADTVPIISPSEIKSEPLEEGQSSSRSSSPKSQGKRVRLSSDMAMMKSVLVDSPSPLMLGPRTSPYSMRSERSSSPSISDGKSRKGRKPKNLLNEVVKNEQKKRRLLSDTKGEHPDGIDEGKGRGRSCSRDGSEISKCSDMTESDFSLGDAGAEESKVDNQELTQKVDKSKTELDVDIETSIPISTINTKVPFNDDSKLDHNILADSNKKKMSLKRSTSLDSDNNNSRNRIKLDNLRNSSDAEDKGKRKTDTDALLKTRSSILTSMSKTFNSKEVSMNIRKARRGRKAAAAPKPQLIEVTKMEVLNGPSLTSGIESCEALDTLSNEIKDLISTLEDEKPSDDKSDVIEGSAIGNTENATDAVMQTKCASKFYGHSEVKPLSDNNSNTQVPEILAKDKDPWSGGTAAPTKMDDSENISLHLESTEESADKQDTVQDESTFKPVASIDKLMDRLKVFEEFDKKRQQTEHMKTGETKSVMVTNDVVLIPKSGADIKPLKDIQSVRSPERPVQKENVLSCFENNSAISIMKRDQVRKSMDLDLPDSITLIKRNSIHTRKESTGSNNSKESNDAITIFEKSLGKDVTLTEIRKSVDKTNTTTSTSLVDIQPFTVTTPASATPSLISVKIDSNEISITPRNTDQSKANSIKARRDTKVDTADIEAELIPAVVKSPVTVPNKSTSTPPVAIKSPEVQPMETEASAPPLESVKTIPDNISMTSDTPKAQEMDIPESSITTITENDVSEVNNETEIDIKEEKKDKKRESPKIKPENDVKESKESDIAKSTKKATRKSLDNQAGPSNILQESPERQKHKEKVLRTLGLVTHKAANEAIIEKELEKRMLAKNFPGGLTKSKTVKSGDYTGTLKTIIKLNRGGDKERGKKYRSSLKMTFKSKNRAAKVPSEQGEPEGADDTFYTIERREGTGTTAEGLRKTYSNRLNHDVNPPAELTVDTSKDSPALNLVIPEKASSFSIHPGRLCMDTCSYCGGKFGLFDTPCHIAQMKSADRQKKVLDNEEKLTIDSCLCDACYRHVDRRANCPSYRKRPLPKALTMPDPVATSTPTSNNIQPADKIQSEKSVSPSLEDESSGESASSVAGATGAMCHTSGCGQPSSHSIRRKWLIKMRSRVNDVLRLELDYPGLHTIPLCSNHYRALQPLMTCRLCLRNKHHNLHLLKHGFLELNPLLSKEGIPVEFAERPVLCKLCRYYCTLLQRPGYNDKHAKGYRTRLLKIYNIDVPPEAENVTEDKKIEQADISITKQKKKSKIKNKQRKSSDQNQYNDVTEPIVEIREGMEKFDDFNGINQSQPNLDQDIESLISSNKIMVPKNAEATNQEMPDHEMAQDVDGPLIPLDKQTELQYLLQKQNNPAQFLKKNATNLTPKQKNIFKTLNITIQKSSQQQKICDKNARKLQKIGQMMLQDKNRFEDENDITKGLDAGNFIKNISLNDECTIETIPSKKSADINTLKNKWQMSESFTQVKKNISELSKKSDKTTTEGKYSNPVKRLETNPSISVRELFPGEEEMNLQGNIDFNNVKGVTPEGWEKCNTTIQYDVETKKLWNELQRPYGNQSSFLRHLVILEKYFRNGDLVLTQNASGNAVVYTDSVQSRLKAYDNVPSEPKRSEVTTEVRKKNANSLLKSNHITTEPEKNKPVEAKNSMPPPPAVFLKPKTTKSLSEKMRNKPLPPELIAINTPNAQGRKAIQNVLHNIQQLVKGVSASDPTEIASAPLPPPKVDSPKLEVPKLEQLKSVKKPKTTSKPWRPTLMPITQEDLARISREPHQIAVDGRSLPSLVQVLSSGKRYHITLLDYNKMCVMRRERLQQLQDGDGKKGAEPESIITEIQPSTKLGNGGTVRQTIEKTDDKIPDLGDLSTLGISAANILKNVGLKNITIAPIPAKTSTVTSPSTSPATTTSATKMTDSMIALPKIPKSLTVIPQLMDGSAIKSTTP